MIMQIEEGDTSDKAGIELIKMKKITFVLILCILAAIHVGYAAQQTSIFAPSATAPEYQSIFVTQVVDGDTVTVEGGMRVRLIGIDAPERDEEDYHRQKHYRQKHYEEDFDLPLILLHSINTFLPNSAILEVFQNPLKTTM